MPSSQADRPADLAELIASWAKPRRVNARRVVGALCAASAALTVVLGAHFWWTRHRALTAARDHARGEAARAAQVIEAELHQFRDAVNAVAADVDSGRVTRKTLVARLRAGVEAMPEISGLGAAFAPLAYDSNLRLYAPYVQRRKDSVDVVALDSLTDYTQSQDWYRDAMRGAPGWSEPAVAVAEGAVVVGYSAPFRLEGAASPSGVIHGALSLSEMDELVSSLDLGEFGYGFLVSKGGFPISHPYPERAQRMLKTATRSEVQEMTDPVTGQPCWLFTEPVPSAGWTVGVVFFKGLIARSPELRRRQIRFAVALVVTLCLLLAFLLEPYRRNHDAQTLWAGSVLGSLLLAVGIGWLWLIGYGGGASGSRGTPLVDKASVRRFTLDATRRTLKTTGRLPVLVPTGMFIQTLDITGPNTAAVTGYVWQKYPKSTPPSVARGFVLPDATDRSITEAYRRSDADAETIGWYVKANVRQSFDYSGYPLDEQDFRLRLWHLDLDGDVVLVPDLDSYRIIHPLARAGLEPEFRMPGWKVEQTRFSSRLRERTTSFGTDASHAGATGTELSFDVLLHRRILEPVFSSLLPLCVSSFMVFMLLLMIRESTRSNIIATFSAYSALFFVIILSQLDLRRRVSGANILYIEYFYFATYGAIVCAALVTLTNGYPGILPPVEQREHFYPKLLFWPVMMGTLALVTLWAFY